LVVSGVPELLVQRIDLSKQQSGHEMLKTPTSFNEQEVLCILSIETRWGGLCAYAQSLMYCLQCNILKWPYEEKVLQELIVHKPGAVVVVRSVIDKNYILKILLWIKNISSFF
jgi:hypothetical protein